MEFTEEMLERMVYSLAYLKTRIDLLQGVLTHESPGIAEQIDKMVEQAVGTPQFQQAYRELLETWKGQDQPPH